MKKLIAIGAMALALTTCSTIATGEQQASAVAKVVEVKNALTIKSILLHKNAQAINRAVKKLKTHVNKTWYVFSGDSPSGWDCSGLTMWFYKQLNVQLEHRATKQQNAGVNTTSPKAGDIVVFKYKNSKYAYHVGIYIGNGKMVHAPKHGHLTRIESIKIFAGKSSEVFYRRVIPTV